MEQWIKDVASSLLWLGSLLWCRFDPWPEKFYMLQAWPKKKKKEEEEEEEGKKK